MTAIAPARQRGGQPKLTPAQRAEYANRLRLLLRAKKVTQEQFDAGMAELGAE